MDSVAPINTVISMDMVGLTAMMTVLVARRVVLPRALARYAIDADACSSFLKYSLFTQKFDYISTNRFSRPFISVHLLGPQKHPFPIRYRWELSADCRSGSCSEKPNGTAFCGAQGRAPPSLSEK